MTDYSDNYYLRKCFLEREQVPTQSVMIKKMSPALANVYFNSMTPKLKVLAGLEPRMKGGGSDWYVPPKDLLQGRAVLKPVKKEHLSKLGFNGIYFFGEKIVDDHCKQKEEEKRKLLLENDNNWKKHIEAICRQKWEDASKVAALQNTDKIQEAFREFTAIFKTSLTKIESILFDASIKEIKRVRDEAQDKMLLKYKTLLKQQATGLYDKYTKILAEEKEILKAKFITDVEKLRADMGNRIHDINVDKHVAVEKLRCLLEYQNLACLAYIAVKEREACQSEIQQCKREHEKKVKKMQDEIAYKDFEIKLEEEKEKKRLEFNKIWQKKVCHVVKKFQEFIMYCLHNLPEHADFFINMEKLMLLQMSDVIENPSAESIVELDDECVQDTPIPTPHPFYLFCDKGYKSKVDQNLCPKHCTSSASQLPVIVINKKCIYAACDTIELSPEKVQHYISGDRGNDDDVTDDHDYTYDIPAKYTSSQQLHEVKLESSIIQILQKEFTNIRNLPVECCLKRVPYCFCSRSQSSKNISESHIIEPEKKYCTITSMPSGEKIVSRDAELDHEREPKWDSYLNFIKPTKCKCAKIAKKHLAEHLPPYMRKMSTFESPELPNYEQCSLNTLKKLVNKARGKKPPIVPNKSEPKTKDACTQYVDQEYDYLCTCFSEDEIEKLFQDIDEESKLFNTTDTKFRVVDGAISPTHLEAGPSSFATERALSLMHLLLDTPHLEEIFKKKDCNF